MSEKYSYSYSVADKKEAQEIRKKYEPKTNKKELSTLEQIKKLDRSVTKKGEIISLIIGVIGTLIMGVGMCCVMVWGDKLFVAGIIVGIIGIVAVLLAYPVYKRVVEKQRKKITPLIMRLTDDVLKK